MGMVFAFRITWVMHGILNRFTARCEERSLAIKSRPDYAHFIDNGNSAIAKVVFVLIAINADFHANGKMFRLTWNHIERMFRQIK